MLQHIKEYQIFPCRWKHIWGSDCKSQNHFGWICFHSGLRGKRDLLWLSKYLHYISFLTFCLLTSTTTINTWTFTFAQFVFLPEMKAPFEVMCWSNKGVCVKALQHTPVCECVTETDICLTFRAGWAVSRRGTGSRGGGEDEDEHTLLNRELVPPRQHW